MHFQPHERGQGLVEYGLTLILVGIAIVGALMFLAPYIGNVFSQVASNFPES